MALGTGYERQGCYLARALEVVGERWTLLIVRDLFYGVHRFSDFLAHLDISRGILSDRLDTLVSAGVVRRQTLGREVEYLLTDAGRELWPVIYSLSVWGERHVAADHPPRRYSHATCGTDVDGQGYCATCAIVPAVGELIVRPVEGTKPPRREDPVARALRAPHRMLEPIP